MRPAIIKPGIFAVGAIDWNRRLFDSLIPLPDGTSYNAYMVKGSQKTALIDTVDPSMTESLFQHLEQTGIDTIDYVIANHAEQDHSGSLPAVLAKFPAAKLVTNTKCKGLLIDHLSIAEDRFIEMADGQTLSLGDRTLKFILTPWVHWPETMVTYLVEDGILFSCDFFGAHLAASDVFVTDEGILHETAMRYFAEIMMPFRTNIEKNLEKIKDYPIKMIAPSHGPVHDKPQFIIDLWKSWVFDPPKNKVVIAYVSMHGSTDLMVRHLTQAIGSQGVEVKVFDLTVADIGKLAMELVEAATIIVGTPTVLAGPHPLAAQATLLVNALRPRLKYATIIGSYGWGGKTLETIKGLMGNLNVELLEPILIKGSPKASDYGSLEKLAETIAEKHKGLQRPSTWRVSCNP